MRSVTEQRDILAEALKKTYAVIEMGFQSADPYGDSSDWSRVCDECAELFVDLSDAIDVIGEIEGEQNNA